MAEQAPLPLEGAPPLIEGPRQSQPLVLGGAPLFTSTASPELAALSAPDALGTAVLGAGVDGLVIGLGSSSGVNPFLKFLSPSPSPLPMSASLLGPQISRATNKNQQKLATADSSHLVSLLPSGARSARSQLP